MNKHTWRRLIALCLAAMLVCWLPAQAINEDIPAGDAEAAAETVSSDAPETGEETGEVTGEPEITQAEEPAEETPEETPETQPAEAADEPETPPQPAGETEAPAAPEEPAEEPAGEEAAAEPEAPAQEDEPEAPAEESAAEENAAEETGPAAEEPAAEEPAAPAEDGTGETQAAEEQPAEPVKEEPAEPEKPEEAEPEEAEPEEAEPEEAPQSSETEIDGIRIIMAPSDPQETGSLPSVRKITDDRASACAEAAFAPPAGEGETLRTRLLLLKISGGEIAGKVTVRMEKAGLKAWKREYGEAAPSAVLARYDAAKGQAEKLNAAVNWEEDTVLLETEGETVLCFFLTAVTAETVLPGTEEPEETQAAPAETAPQEQPEEQPAAEQPEEKADGAEAAETAEAPAAFDQSVVVDGVKISVYAAPGVFPAGAVLSVKRVNAAQQAQVDRAIGRAQDDRTQTAATYSFDISILDENGTELQPADGQNVSVSFSLAEVADSNLQTQVYHMEEREDGGLDAEKLDTVESGETVTARSGGFSVYTVSFTYEERQFAVLANTVMPVVELVNAVGLAGTPTAASLSAAEEGKGLALQGEAPAWTLAAQANPASEAQKLTVTIQQIDYSILVQVSEQQQETSDIDYLGEDGQIHTWSGGYATVQDSTWQAAGGFSGWWVASGEVNLEQRVMVYGDVKLILCDFSLLNANGGIQVSPGSSLTIYSQGKKNGALNASSREPSENRKVTGAGIGGAYTEQGAGDAGTIRITGGTVTAVSGAPGCAGIGGGTDGKAAITITGGTVTATGCGSGAGIGGKADGTTVSITGGTVTGKGGSDGGTGITGREGNQSTYQSTLADSGTEEERDPNVIYAPDGSVYNPVSDVGDRTGQIWTTGGKVPVTYQEEEKPKAYQESQNPYKHKLRASYTPAAVTAEAETAEDQTDAYADLDSSNVILVAMKQGAVDEELWELLMRTGTVYMNHRTEEAGTVGEILGQGLDGADREQDPGLWTGATGVQTAEDLLARFGYAVWPEDGTDEAGGRASDAERVEEAISWIQANADGLNRKNTPFFMSVQLNGPEETSGSAGTEQAGRDAVAETGKGSRGSQGKFESRIAEQERKPDEPKKTEKHSFTGHLSGSGISGPAVPEGSGSGSSGPDTSDAGQWSATGPGGDTGESGEGPAGPWETADSADESPAGPWETAGSMDDGPAGPWETAGSTDDDSPAGPWETAAGSSDDGPAGPWEDTGSAPTGEGAVGPWVTSGAAATPTDLPGTGGDAADTENCLDTLLNAVYEAGMMDHTVIILVRMDDGQVLIQQPGQTESVMITAETQNRDLLPTILALKASEPSEQAILDILAGRNMLAILNTEE